MHDAPALSSLTLNLVTMPLHSQKNQPRSSQAVALAGHEPSGDSVGSQSSVLPAEVQGAAMKDTRPHYAGYLA